MTWALQTFPAPSSSPNSLVVSFGTKKSAQVVFGVSPHHASGLQLHLNHENRKRFVDSRGSSKDTKVSEMWSCRESNPLQKSRCPAEMPILTTRNDAKVRETTCGYAKGVDGVNTRSRLRSDNASALV
jgi:hypothetical protein